MRDIKYMLDGKRIHIREHTIANSERYGYKYCAISGKKLNNGEECYLIMNNYELFPSCWLSKTEADNLGIDECLEKIYDKYKIYEPLKNIFNPY